MSNKYEQILKEVLRNYDFSLEDFKEGRIPEKLEEEIVERADWNYSAVVIGVYPNTM